MTRISRASLLTAVLASCCLFTGCANGQDATGQSSTNRAFNATNSKSKSRLAQPVPARMVNGKPEGLYYMQKMWIATRFLEKSCWYFAPDGNFYENLSTGFSPEDLKAHKGPRGTYKVSGDMMEVTWSDGQTSKDKLEIVDGGFNWDTGSYLPVEAFAVGKSIVGSYEGGASIGGGSNSVIVSKSLRLEADGRYTMSGITTATATSDGTQARVGSSESEIQGTWQLDGFSLTLVQSNGTKTQHIVFPFDDDKTPVYPDRIFVGGTMYKKQ